MIKVKQDSNNRRVFIQIEKSARVTERALRKSFYYIGKDLVSSASKSILKKPKSGRVYLIRRGGRLRRHQASAPGEAPANFTGNLRRSLDFIVQGSKEMTFGADADYAKFLELGTRKMEKRPYLIKSINDNERNITKHFENQIKKFLREN